MDSLWNRVWSKRFKGKETPAEASHSYCKG